MEIYVGCLELIRLLFFNFIVIFSYSLYLLQYIMISLYILNFYEEVCFIKEIGCVDGGLF